MLPKSSILFIALSDQTGANTPIIKVAGALSNLGYRVQVLVRYKSQHNVIVSQLPPRNGYMSELGYLIDAEGTKVPLKRDLKYLFNTANEENSYQDTDIILQHLNFTPNLIFVGITYDFLTSSDILNLAEATKAVVYNIAVDMSHFTGGCHFAWDCEGYKIGCHNCDCPAILEKEHKDLAGRNFLKKAENAAKGNFRILAGTEWTKVQALASAIYKNQDWVLNISGVIDLSVFNPLQRHLAKAVFGLSPDKFYVLAGAENTLDERKGYSFFVASLNLFWEALSPAERQSVEIISLSSILNHEVHREIKFAKKNVEYIRDDRLLSLFYQAADVFVNSSIEDSGPAMLIEAMSCGTPVVAFKMGAAEYFVRNGETGFVVKNRDTAALAAALHKLYRMPPAQREAMGIDAHEKVAEIGSMSSALKTIETILHQHKEDFVKNQKTISVAMCIYNGEKYLSEQLDSILSQNIIPQEIVICDDASTDRSIQIIESYRQRYPAIIKLYRNEQNLGVVKNFEKAINLCTQELIFLSDQDDVWYPHKTEVMVRVFNQYPDVEAVCHNLQICHKNREYLKHTMWETMGFHYFLNQQYPEKDYLFQSMFFGNMVTGAAFCFRNKGKPWKFRDDIKNVIHDYQLAIHYLTENSLHFHNESLGLYRQHEHQQIGVALQHIAAHKKHIQHYYETNNPIWNIGFIKRLKKQGDIFPYLKIVKHPSYNRVIQDHLDRNMSNIILSKSIFVHCRDTLYILYSKIRNKISPKVKAV